MRNDLDLKKAIQSTKNDEKKVQIRVNGQTQNACIFISIEVLSAIMAHNGQSLLEQKIQNAVDNGTDKFNASLTNNTDQAIDKGFGDFEKGVARQYYSSKVELSNEIALRRPVKTISDINFINELRDRLKSLIQADPSNLEDELNLWSVTCEEDFNIFFNSHGLTIKTSILPIIEELKKPAPNAQIIRERFFTKCNDTELNTYDNQIMQKIITPMSNHHGPIGYTLKIQGHVRCFAKATDNKYYAFDPQTGVMECFTHHLELLRWIKGQISEHDYECSLFEVRPASVKDNKALLSSASSSASHSREPRNVNNPLLQNLISNIVVSEKTTKGKDATNLSLADKTDIVEVENIDNGKTLKTTIGKALQGVNNYLLRPRDFFNTHLGFFARIFDNQRGKKRACVYQDILNSSKYNDMQKALALYALLSTQNGVVLKEDVAEAILGNGRRSIHEALSLIENQLTEVLIPDLQSSDNSIQKRMLANRFGYFARQISNYANTSIIGTGNDIPDSLWESLTQTMNKAHQPIKQPRNK